MAIIDFTAAKVYELIPEGTYQAVCSGVWELGRQQFNDFNGNPNSAEQLVIRWEVNKRMKDGQKFQLTKKYNIFVGEKATLRIDMEKWFGTSLATVANFDTKKLIGLNCMLQIMHKESKNKKYANIVSIIKLPEGIPVLHVENQNSETPDWVKELQSKAIVGAEDFLSTQIESTNIAEADFDDCPF